MPIPREDAGQITDIAATPYVGKGDFVVGQYTESGKAEASGAPPLPDAASVAAKIAANARAAGGVALPPLKAAKKGTKRKAVRPTVPPPVQSNILLPPISNPNPNIQIDVVFNTQLGKIKASTIGVLDGETSLVLVYRNEQDISYEPNVGATIQLMIDGKPVDVMYPGFKYSWLDGTMRLMVFAKIQS